MRFPLRRGRREEEFEKELNSHLEMFAEDRIEQGESRQQAVISARRHLGNSAHIKDITRDVWGWMWLEHLMGDLHYGIKTFAANPGFAIVAIITLALGIGANTAIFSVVEGVVLSPLPFNQPDRLVIAWQNNVQLKRQISLSYLDFQDWQLGAQAFQQMAATRSQDRDLSSPGAAEHLKGAEVTSGFFNTLGVKLTLGRDFTPEEDRPGGTPVAIISDRLWKEKFGGSNDVLEKSTVLDGVERSIVGVMPPRFNLLDNADSSEVYTPLGQSFPTNLADRVTRPGILAIARLKPNVTLGQSQADLGAVQQHLDELYPNADRALEPHIEPLKQAIVGDVGGTLLLLLGAVGLVLLIACGNVANLLLARSAARSREFAVRMALGATRTRIVRQLVTESMLLSLAGGTLGLLIAKWGIRPVLAVAPQDLPRSENIGVNIGVLSFTFGVSIAVGILFGLAPALKSSNTDLQTVMKEGGRGYVRGRHRAQHVLVVVQMALTLVLLTGGSLLFRTVHHLLTIDPGLDARHTITFKVGLSPSLTKTPEGQRIAFKRLMDRIRAIPGIQSADVTTLEPLGLYDNSLPFWVGTQNPPTLSEAPRVLTFSTGPDYLKATGIPLIQGRFLNDNDTVNSEHVVVIDTVLAHTYFPNENPVGKILSFVHVGPYRIVGVVGHVEHWGMDVHTKYTQPQAYSQFYQISDEWVPVMYAGTTVVIRTPLNVAEVMPAIKNVVYSASSDQPVYDVRTMEQFVSDLMISQRFSMILLGAFAVLALLLASIGIYGVISYLITERTREIGIRVALGAERWDVLRMVVGQGFRLSVAGVVIGIMAALILTRVLSSFSQLLSGVSANDPLTFAAVSIVLVIASLLACYIPARRATRVNPIVALRCE